MALSKEDLALRQKAIDAGKTEYTRTNGQIYNIRNLGNKRHSGLYKGQGGRDELKISRKSNRGSGTDSTRARNERLSTPPGTDRQAFGAAMTAASAEGKEGHHKTPVSLTGNALAEMDPERQALYHKRFDKAGVPLGNMAENIDPLTQPAHHQVHGEGEAVQRTLKAMQSRGGSLRFSVLNFMDPYVDPNQLAYDGGIESATNARMMDMSADSGRMYIPLAN